MEANVNLALRKLGVNFCLKDQQRETLESLYEGNDCISVLPTGYGKSLIFQMLPWVLKAENVSRMVIVICPLTAIMQDQVMSLCKKGIKAYYINIQGTGICCVKRSGEESGSDSDDLVQPEIITSTDMSVITRGEVEILYCHPEALFTKSVSRMLRTKVFQKIVCCIAVDEVHMIEEWGEDFRPKFQQIGELTALFPNAAHLAVTATATPSSIAFLSKTLQYSKPVVITVNPDRPNLYLEIKTRLPNIHKYDKYDDIIQPLTQELKDLGDRYPVTIVYVESLEALGYFYQYINYELKDDQYIGDPIPENRIFGQYHKDYTTAMKLHIVTELKKEKPKLRLILATVALGMGLDAPGIVRIVHCRPPTTLEKYFQEIGRAGRRGQKAIATMYINNNDLAKHRKGLSEAMVKYCKGNHGCFRLQLLQYFGFDKAIFNGPKDECCSFCRSQNSELE